MRWIQPRAGAVRLPKILWLKGSPPLDLQNHTKFILWSLMIVLPDEGRQPKEMSLHSLAFAGRHEEPVMKIRTLRFEHFLTLRMRGGLCGPNSDAALWGAQKNSWIDSRHFVQIKRQEQRIKSIRAMDANQDGQEHPSVSSARASY